MTLESTVRGRVNGGNTNKAPAAPRDTGKRFGTVKWFGGFNSKTGRENEFGFISALSGEDIFFHKKSFRGDLHPVEGEIVCFEVGERRGKSEALGVQRLADSGASGFQVLETLVDWEVGTGTSLSQIQKRSRVTLARYAFQVLVRSEPWQVREIAAGPHGQYLFLLLRDCCDATERLTIFETLSSRAGLEVFRDLSWDVIPPQVFASREASLVAFVEALPVADAAAKCLTHLSLLPIDFVIYLLIKSPQLTKEALGTRWTELEARVRSLFVGTGRALSGYVKDAYERELKPIGGYKAAPVLWGIMEPFLFKKYLHEKTAKFMRMYDESENLARNSEIFVLHGIFSLHLAGNSTEVVYDVFKQELWQALIDGCLDLQAESLQALFPRCGSLGRLSCEAVYWKKKDIYLCRGKLCGNPQVMPEMQKHFLDFSIFDWFCHYGINYTQEARPSQRDFPIKLAGYFNRLSEIYPVLHCRDCEKLMAPDFRYSRTQYRQMENGKLVTKEMAASYRLTVFHCNNEACEQHGVRHYINHCMGFRCFELIDSRDLREQCDAGRYVCAECGSCCETHAEPRPMFSGLLATDGPVNNDDQAIQF